eukprot:6084529-Prymnesium_polylepis.1
MALALERARKQRTEPPPRVPPAAGKLWRLYSSCRHYALCSQLFGPTQVVVWAAQVRRPPPCPCPSTLGGCSLSREARL